MGISLSSTMGLPEDTDGPRRGRFSHGRIMVAILILQDISVMVLVLLESMLGASGQSPLWLLAVAMGKAVIFVALAIAPDSGLCLGCWATSAASGHVNCSCLRWLSCVWRQLLAPASSGCPSSSVLL